MIVCEGLCMDLQDFHLHNLDLRVGTGEYCCIMGPSGAGKTVLLECIAGLHRPSEGRILIRGKDVTAMVPEQRRISIVYQDYSLFPHLTGYENVAFGLRMQKIDPDRIRTDVISMLEKFRIAYLLDRYPSTMSGGEQQRVALARALIVQPEILLLDEAFAALDPVSRQQCMHDLRTLQQSRKLTVIHVTHAWDEAHILADRVAVIIAGKFVQHGTVQEVYARPASESVARFVGTDNVLPGRIVAHSPGLSTVDVGGIRIRACSDAPLTGNVIVCIRGAAWNVIPVPARLDSVNLVTGTLRERSRLGDLERMEVDCGTLLIAIARSTDLQKQNIQSGDPITLQVDPSDVHLIGEDKARPVGNSGTANVPGYP
ncbi:MAG: ATP-binding cassette domain-containing protein [Methanomicrobiales archaeon]|nr:ATP-binding cassette domain-containing protein [Methanomicrobiales archaeon]